MLLQFFYVKHFMHFFYEKDTNKVYHYYPDYDGPLIM